MSSQSTSLSQTREHTFLGLMNHHRMDRESTKWSRNCDKSTRAVLDRSGHRQLSSTSGYTAEARQHFTELYQLMELSRSCTCKIGRDCAVDVCPCQQVFPQYANVRATIIHIVRHIIASLFDDTFHFARMFTCLLPFVVAPHNTKRDSGNR